jgi:hypothetical protein
MKMMPVCGLPIAPTMQAIIVDRVSIINPQLASIIGDDTETVMAPLEKTHAGCPASGKVVMTSPTWPSPSCVPVVNNMAPASHVWPSPIQVWTPSTHAEVKRVLPEEATPVSSSKVTTTPALCTDDHPSISGVRTTVPEEHTSMTAVFKHFKPDHAPPTKMSGSFSVTPTVTTIVVNRVPIVNE